MKIARCSYRAKEIYGVLTDKKLISLPALAKRLKEKLPETLEGFVSSGSSILDTAESLLEKANEKTLESVSAPLNGLSFLAPIVRPPKIICLGLNYLDHAAETGAAIPNEPIIFMKPRTAIIGPNETIIKVDFVKQLDYEGELAVVIGKKAKNVSISESKNYVFGYTVFNDVSAREIQFGDKQWTRGKSFDTFAPTGPCLTTEPQLRDTSNLAIRTRINGELRQNGTTRKMVFSVEQIVHHLSRVMTLEPCDIIATGTPAGVGFAMKPPSYLQNGDVISIEIDGIGTLENTVKEEATF